MNVVKKSGFHELRMHTITYLKLLHVPVPEDQAETTFLKIKEKTGIKTRFRQVFLVLNISKIIY